MTQDNVVNVGRAEEEGPITRAKMTLESVWANQWGKGTKCIFRVQYDNATPEDKRFSLATPSGFMEMVVDNPAVTEKMKVGQAYYLDFTPVPPLAKV